jgi:hypothetical protein
VKLHRRHESGLLVDGLALRPLALNVNYNYNRNRLNLNGNYNDNNAAQMAPARILGYLSVILWKHTGICTQYFALTKTFN